MELSNKTYDILKWVAQNVLPALGTLYFALSGIWGFPYGEQVVGTITAIDAFLGVILKLSSDSYNGDGTLIVDTNNPFKDVYSIALTDYPAKLAEKDTVILRVSRPKHMDQEIKMHAKYAASDSNKNVFKEEV